MDGEELWPVSVLSLDGRGYFILLNARKNLRERIELVMLTSNLTVRWGRSYESGEALEAVRMVNVSGVYILAGTEYIWGKKYGVIFAVDAQGEILWKRSYSYKWGDMEIKDIERAHGSKESFIVGGTVKSKDGDQDLWLSQMNVDGNISWGGELWHREQRFYSGYRYGSKGIQYSCLQ